MEVEAVVEAVMEEGEGVDANMSPGDDRTTVGC